MTDKQEIIVLDKKPGETPLEAIETYKLTHPESKAVPMTYAGRLDPLASGVLLVLAGEARFAKEQYLNLDKEYEVEILLGVGTDTGDVLGLVKEVKNDFTEPSDWSKYLNSFVGKRLEEYPAYSSKTVGGKQLHTLARSGELPETMPKKEIEIYNVEYLGERGIDLTTLQSEVGEKIMSVTGDFRQAEVIASWAEVTDTKFHLITVTVTCSSGAYMRNLSEKIGQGLGVPALAFNIYRKRVGSFTI